LTLVTASACIAAAGGSAAAQIPFTPCADTNNFACGHLTVPLDPSGRTPGTLTLAMRRHRAPVEGGSSAVIALAGGPGQAAIPLTEAFLELLGTASATRDLIVFDQRGTGLSHPLACRPPKRTSAAVSPGQAIVRCARGLGAARSFFTTPDSVADIESIRRAGGYEKLVLVGTSYGTKVAEQYAQDHPTHVEALVLDSVVTPNGPDPLNRSTFAAVPRILRQLCGYRECVHITPNPVADLTRVLARARRGPIVGRVIDDRGGAHRRPISSDDLLGILLAGDLNPLLRSELIPAVRAASRGDPAELARLLSRTEASGGEEASDAVDAPLYLTTTCEDEAFPWTRGESPPARLSTATANVDRIPASSFAPFTRANALDLSPIDSCAFWPYATPGPALDEAALPDVPALILSGEADLRTPTANAQEVASAIPDSRLLIVPDTGHSVLTSEPGSCATDALRALFTGAEIKSCTHAPPPTLLRLPPLPPARLRAVTPARGYGGAPGRTLHAVRLTLDDLSRQLFVALLEELGGTGISTSPSLSGGGLRAGWFELTGSTTVLHGYSYVPGVTISGRVTGSQIALAVGGYAAAHGGLHGGGTRSLVGTLGGTHVRLTGEAASAGAAGNGVASSDASTATGIPQRLHGLGEALAQLPNGASAAAEMRYLLGLRRIAAPSTPR
jgi:pimeloyl-ACP methyl ester carboxylesterase